MSSMIPILTIPEGAYDLSQYTTSPLSYNRRRQSRLLAYLIRLTHGSALSLTVIYLLGLFVLKPLLQTKADRHFDYLEHFRGKLRDCYLNLVGRVSYIPIVAINRNGKLVADSIAQTTESSMKKTAASGEDDSSSRDKLNQGGLVAKLSKLDKILNTATSYQIDEMPHYKSSIFALQDLQNKSDMVYFNTHELFSVIQPHQPLPSAVQAQARAQANGNAQYKQQAGTSRKKNLATDVKLEIRNIKGLFMSGQV